MNRNLETLMQKRVDGLLLLCTETHQPSREIMQRYPTVPTVMMDWAPFDGDSDLIQDNSLLGGDLATQYLIDKGHTRIACITGPLDKTPARLRLEGYRAAMKRAGLNIPDGYEVTGDFEFNGGFDAMRQLLSHPLRPQAVFTGNDAMAVGVYQALYQAELQVPQDIRLKVDNLCGPGVNDVSFTLRKGEILGVSGLMGAGRTELMKVLYGALPRTSGYVTLDGHEVVTRSPQDGLANGIVYISEDRKRDGLVLGMSVKENMSLTALRYFSRAGGSLKHADEQQAVSDFIRLFNVKTPSMEQAIGLLSGGNQQKVAIARGLMTRPKVLILDEPTRGVDVGAKKEIYQLINQFKADGLSIILVSSEMPEVLGMSDRIIVMHEGHLSGEFTREQATQEVLMAAAVGKLNRVNQE